MALLSTTSNSIKTCGLALESTFTFARNRVERVGRATIYGIPTTTKLGRSLNTHVGYIAERLFIDDADVAAHPEQDFREKPEEEILSIKIFLTKMVNIMGKIDNDRMPIGYPTIPGCIWLWSECRI